MRSSILARLSPSALVVLALAAAACSGSNGSQVGGPCDGSPPSCGVYCPGGEDSYASCLDDQWTCPDLVACSSADGGATDAGDGGPPCTGDASLECGGCDGTSVEPLCTTEGLACPVVNCPLDAGGSDAGKTDAAVDAGGDLCSEGAPCNAGESCSVGTDAGLITSCSCAGSTYACE